MNLLNATFFFVPSVRTVNESWNLLFIWRANCLMVSLMENDDLFERGGSPPRHMVVYTSPCSILVLRISVTYARESTGERTFVSSNILPKGRNLETRIADMYSFLTRRIDGANFRSIISSSGREVFLSHPSQSKSDIFSPRT